MKRFYCCIGDETGSTAVEYGLIAALLGVVLVTGFGALTENLFLVFDTIREWLAQAG